MDTKTEPVVWPPRPVAVPEGYPPFTLLYGTLPLELAAVDFAYHRGAPAAQRARLGRYAEGSMRPVMVNDRGDGWYWVIDGVQRLYLAHEAGYTHVPAQVYRVDRATEARYFIEMNDDNRNRVTEVERFRAELVAQDARALAIRAVVEQAGFTLVFRASGGGANATAAIVVLRALTACADAPEGWSTATLYHTLSLINATWPGVPGNATGDMLTAVDRVRGQAQQMQPPKDLPRPELDRLFVRTLCAFTPAQLLVLAQAEINDAILGQVRANTYVVRPRKCKALAQVMIKLLNATLDDKLFPKRARRKIPLMA